MRNKEAILDYINSHTNVYVDGLHGLSHWERVEKIGEFLTQLNGADFEVVKIFAYTHDLGRLNDGDDPEHGLRSAKIVEDLYNQQLIIISPEQYQKLIYACSNHAITLALSDDLTIQTCWDADRLDLWRAGIEPNLKFLYTSDAKKSETIIWAKNLSLGLSF